MSNFTRISLLVAAAAGLFVCGANSLHLKQKITRLRVDLQTQTTGRAQAESDLAGAKTEVKSLTGDLKSTKTALATAHSEREQALADTADFIQYLTKKLSLNGKVVVFGGSYAGSLAAWFREKYPNIAVGAIASSAPVLAEVDFKEYFGVVSDSLGTECSQNIR